MIKSRFALRLGGALAIALAFLLVLSACSESSKTPDETVEVRLTENSDALAAKSLTATSGSYSTASSDELYWTYTAVKADSYFSTGQTSSETWVSTSTDDDGNVTVSAGLPESLPGKFSVGAWVFTFNAYTSADMNDDYLFYQGTGNSVTLSSGDENTVSVTVELYEAVKADEDGNTYGTLVVYGITFVSQDGETQTLSDITLWYSIDDGTLTEDADEAMLASSTDDGLTFEELEPGSHTFYAYVTDTSANVLASGSASAIVKPNLTTTITGDIEEAEDATTSVTLGDLSVSYGSISVSSEEGLTAALSDSEVSTVALASDLTLTEALTVSNDTTIDLGSSSLTAESGISVADGASLTILGSSSSSTLTSTIELGDDSSLNVDGVTLTSSGTYLISSDYGDVDITISDSTLNTTEGGRGIYVMVDDDNSKDATLSITLSNTTINTQSSSSRGISIHGSESDSSSSNLSKLELNISDTVISSTENSSSVQCLAIYRVEEVQISISDSSFICANNQYAFYLYNSGNADTQSKIDISGTTLQGFGAFYEYYTTNVAATITESKLYGENYTGSSFYTLTMQAPIACTVAVSDSALTFNEYSSGNEGLAGIGYLLSSDYTGNSISFENCTASWNTPQEGLPKLLHGIENVYTDASSTDYSSFTYENEYSSSSTTLGESSTSNTVTYDSSTLASILGESYQRADADYYYYWGDSIFEVSTMIEAISETT